MEYQNSSSTALQQLRYLLEKFSKKDLADLIETPANFYAR